MFTAVNEVMKRRETNEINFHSYMSFAGILSTIIILWMIIYFNSIARNCNFILSYNKIVPQFFPKRNCSKIVIFF